MSFRLRVLLLVGFLVVTATTATAWLTLQQASRQLANTVAASERDTAAITKRLNEYGLAHGSWTGVATVVSGLSNGLRQRIRLVDDAGVVIADSDLIAGAVARPVDSAPIAIDPRPPVPPLNFATAEGRAAVAIKAIYVYRGGWAMASCLSRAGIDVRYEPGDVGIPAFTPATADASAVTTCRSQSGVTQSQGRALRGNAFACTQRAEDRACLRGLFAREVSGHAAPVLRLYIGARNEVAYRLSSGSIALAASAVILAAIATGLLLTRRVLRPISALTAASRRLGDGALDERVPVSGRDELAQLGRAFNRMAESLARSEQRQRQLIGDVAHELRTPLQNLRGYLEALADGVLQPSPELFASLHEEALLHQRIIDDLQDLALAEAGALTYHKGLVDLAELVETCQTAHAAVAETSGVTLRVVAPATIPVYADPDRLRQVLGNLIRNAVAATAPGGTITLEVSRSDDRAVVRVVDTGKGIAEQDVPHVFDRLWRADAARRRGAGGSGLGLAIARQITRDHDGTIEVASRVGAGTTFTVTLPAATPTTGAG